MESFGLVFGVVGLSMGVMAFTYSTVILKRLEKLEGEMKEIALSVHDIKSNLD